MREKLVRETRRDGRGMRMLMLAALAQLLVAGVASAQVGTTGQGRPVSLQEALRMASDQSEQITMARAGVLRAEGQQQQSRSELYPQLNSSLSYSRALASQFAGAFTTPADTTAPLPVCPAFTPDTGLPLDVRVRQLESQFNCSAGSSGGGLSLGNLPFGRENTYQLGLSFSQNLFAGGRIMAQNRVARAGVETARISLRQAEAQLSLDITQAYYDAVLSDRLLGIAQATLEQSEATLKQATVARQVGTQPEFELLRAQVTRDNQRPVVIQRQSDRDLAYLRLKQLLNIPADQPLQLTSDLSEDSLPAAPAQAEAWAGVLPSAQAADSAARSVVDQAQQAVAVQQGLVQVAESQRLPSLVLTSQYGRVAYPNSGLPTWGGSRPNWNVGVSFSVPLYTGGRLTGARKIAQANLLESQARLQQVRELAALDTRNTYQQLLAAQATWEASTGTVGQAQRAYQIAEVRYREGISTQLELTDSRILLQQAQANRALAARNLQVARARVTLLPDLPLGAATAGAAQQQGGQQAQQQQTQQQAPQQQQAGGASLTGIPGAGGL
jgi:outer membrane protein TolC